MNKKQIYVMWLGILAQIIALVVLPWRGIHKSVLLEPFYNNDYIGYSLIFTPPKVTYIEKTLLPSGKYHRVEIDKYHIYSLDWTRLSITITIILLVTLGLIFTVKESKTISTLQNKEDNELMNNT